MEKVEILRFNQLPVGLLYQILKLRVDVFVVEQNCPYPELDDKDEGALHVYLPAGNQVAAYLRIITNEPNIRIGRVVTNPHFRGKGLASLLMQKAMAYILQHHANQSIILSAQEHLQNFYGRFGFAPVSDSYLEDGIPHVDMQYIAQKH